MHLMAIRRGLAAAQPAPARSIFDVFVAAQSVADEDLEQARKISLPWLSREVRRTRAVMGDRFWSTGFAANRDVVTRIIDWSHEDGLLSTRLDAEQLFDPSLYRT